MKIAILYLGWGDFFCEEVNQAISESVEHEHDIYIISDSLIELRMNREKVKIIQTVFRQKGNHRKSELYKNLPAGYDVYLFLDSDTRILNNNLHLGFEKAIVHGICMSIAPHYSMDHFFGFEKIMENEGVKAQGQLLYNSGIIFFSLQQKVIDVFNLWESLCEKYSDSFKSDQVFLSLAMEKLLFNPYVLSTAYNHRAMGELLCDSVRIWHSRKKIPDDLNCFENPWPPRRIENGVVVPVRKVKSTLFKMFRNIFVRE